MCEFNLSLQSLLFGIFLFPPCRGVYLLLFIPSAPDPHSHGYTLRQEIQIQLLWDGAQAQVFLTAPQMIVTFRLF